MIEDQKADEIIVTIRGLLKSFKIKTYDEDTQYGLLRHVLIRHGFSTGEIMVVLVTASPVFPSKNNFVKALRKVHPEITTVVQNINDRGTSMVHEMSFSMEKDLSKINSVAARSAFLHSRSIRSIRYRRRSSIRKQSKRRG